MKCHNLNYNCVRKKEGSKQKEEEQNGQDKHDDDSARTLSKLFSIKVFFGKFVRSIVVCLFRPEQTHTNTSPNKQAEECALEWSCLRVIIEHPTSMSTRRNQVGHTHKSRVPWLFVFNPVWRGMLPQTWSQPLGPVFDCLLGQWPSDDDVDDDVD